jgi:ribosomal protein L35AE/L33A
MGSLKAEAEDDGAEQNCEFPVGSTVEYRSTTNNCWIMGRVVAFDANTGLYDLDCRGQVPPERLRHHKPDLSAEQTPKQVFPVGASVEYLSVSLGGWVHGQVLQFHASSGLYDLDCRAQVPQERIRWPGQSDAEPPTPRFAVPPTPGSGAGTRPIFPVGMAVEYQSSSKGCWLPARVLAYHPPSGLYDLDCRPQADPERIRPRVASEDADETMMAPDSARLTLFTRPNDLPVPESARKP